ncbi:MAG: CocE/NonD family hydrolase [Bacteroidia bacterium]
MLTAGAQDIRVNSSALTDHKALPGAVRSIAVQLLDGMTVMDSVTDLDHLFRLQLCAGRYEEAVKSLRLFRAIQPDQQWDGLPALGVQFELFAEVKPMFQNSGADSAALIRTVLDRIYNALPLSSRPYVQTFFHPDLEGLQARYQQLLSKIMAAPKGKVAREDAIRFCRLYLSITIAGELNKAALRYLEDEDNKNYVIEDSLMIPGDDSAKLTAVVVRKQDLTDPLPVILVYSIYAGPGDLGIAKAAADHGYVGVVVNTRGKFLSNGPVVPFEKDADDIWPVLDYLSKQDYCDGRIGMYGGSYLGFSQWSAAKKMHPALKTIVPQVAVAPGIDFPGTGGVMSTYVYQWLRYVSNHKLSDYLSFNNAAYWDSLNTVWYNSGLPFQQFDSVAGKKDSVFQKWLLHSRFDSCWQRTIPYREEYAAVNIPVLSITGYFDDDQYGALWYYDQHCRYNKQATHYLVIGPWDHLGAQSSPSLEYRGYSIDSTGQVQITDLVFAWMDHVFRDGPLPELLQDKVNLQEMGADTWWSGATLASGLADSLRLHLTGDMQGNFLLRPSVPAVSKRIVLSRERDAVPEKAGSYDASVAVLDTVLPAKEGIYFRSDEISDTTYLHGRYNLHLKLIADCYDADLITRLYEQKADGTFFLLGTGLRRISFDAGTEEADFIVPGQLKETDVPSLYFSEKQLLPGSRLVLWLDIHASKSYEFNTGSRTPVYQQARSGFNGIHLQLLGESSLTLPIRKK